MTADLRRLVKKLWRYYKYPSLYTRQRNYKKKNIKKRNVYAVRVHVESYGRRNHSCNISAQSVQGLGSYGTPSFPISYT